MDHQGVRVFFSLLQNVRPGCGAHPASYSMDTRVKHSGREVYHSSPSSAEIKNKWNCTSTSPVCLHVVVRDFLSHLSHARYMPRPPRRNEVAMQCEAPVIQISACCYLPSPHIQPPHHSGLQPPQSASPAHHGSFTLTTMAKDSFKFHNQQVSLSCNLISRISTLIVYMHATKACRGVEVQRHPFLRSALDGDEFRISPSSHFTSRKYPPASR